MTQDQLLRENQNKTGPVIVDVRSDSEYQPGHAPRALHLPFYSLWSRHSEIKSQVEDHTVLGARTSDWYSQILTLDIGLHKHYLLTRPYARPERARAPNGEDFQAVALVS